jgi:cyanophycin synthetase
MNAAPVTVTEVRVLERPNLCLPRPAIKIVVGCQGYLSVDEATLRAIGPRLGTRVVRPAAPDSEQRQRAVMRLGAQVVHRIAAGPGTTKLGVRVPTGGSRAEVVVWFRGAGRVAAWRSGSAWSLRWAGCLIRTRPRRGEPLPRAVTALTEAEQGRHYTRSKPIIPVASVTGTNGKTTSPVPLRRRASLTDALTLDQARSTASGF